MPNQTAINWNSVTDPLDKEVWDRLTTNFWLPEKVPVSNDLPEWNRMSKAEKTAVDKVFGGLTLLDSLQSEIGAIVLHEDAKDEHEKAVFTNIAFMESVHAKSYSTIFSTLRSSSEIDEIFDWVHNHEGLQKKAEIIQTFYRQGSLNGEYEKALRKAASVLLESFLFYSGFYLPLKLASIGKLTNAADIIRLILRDEGVHGFYIGAKFQEHRKSLPSVERYRLDKEVQELLMQLYKLEVKYTEEVYDDLGWSGSVKDFLRYNANKAMMNLGYDIPFTHDCTPEAVILSSMAIDANENHDFFSGSGSSYVMGKAEETTDDDWG